MTNEEYKTFLAALEYTGFLKILPDGTRELTFTMIDLSSIVQMPLVES